MELWTSKQECRYSYNMYGQYCRTWFQCKLTFAISVYKVSKSEYVLMSNYDVVYGSCWNDKQCGQLVLWLSDISISSTWSSVSTDCIPTWWRTRLPCYLAHGQYSYIKSTHQRNNFPETVGFRYERWKMSSMMSSGMQRRRVDSWRSEKNKQSSIEETIPSMTVVGLSQVLLFHAKPPTDLTNFEWTTGILNHKAYSGPNCFILNNTTSMLKLFKSFNILQHWPCYQSLIAVFPA